MVVENVVKSRVTIDVEFLIELFDHHNVDWRSWTIKTIDNLVDELSCGERSISYTNGKILLNSKVVSCGIFFGDMQLLETCLESPTGTLTRNIPCSGKLGISESPRDGMKRELLEELNLDLEPTYIGVTKEPRYQSYYPGLDGVNTHYWFSTPLHIDHYLPEYILIENDIKFTFSWVAITL